MLYRLSYASPHSELFLLRPCQYPDNKQRSQEMRCAKKYFSTG